MRRLALTGCFLAMLLPVTAAAADRRTPLVGGDMLGTYACSGKDVAGHAVTGKIGWTYADGVALMFFARLAPVQQITFIDETWTLESPDTGYIADPSPNSKDTAMYRSGGWKNGKLDWQRMAARSTLYREFSKAPGGVRFAVITAGGDAKRIGYAVRCKRMPTPSRG